MIEKIIKEIHRLKKELDGYTASDGLDYIESYINIIQREQPKVDLEKELNEYFEGWQINHYSETEELLKGNGCTVDIDDVKEIARHFYELGLKTTRKEV